MQPQSSTNTGQTCQSTTTCEPSRQDTHTHTHTQDFSVDLICGGFPCQDISVAGKGAGLAGARSGLWNDFARIIRTVRPRWVVIENVPALTARGLGAVLGDLAEIGFDAEWHCIPASAVGAPHRRERMWVVASRRDVVGKPSSCGQQGIAWRESEQESAHRRSYVAYSSSVFRNGGEHHAGCDSQSQHTISEFGNGRGDDVAANSNSSRRQQQRRAEPIRAEQPAIERSGWWQSEPDVGRVAHGIPSRVDRLRCLGNAVVPQVVEVIGRAILETEARMTA